MSPRREGRAVEGRRDGDAAEPGRARDRLETPREGRTPDTPRGRPAAGPPRLASRLLRAMLPHADRDEVLAEMTELWRLRCARHGVRLADRWYRRQVLSFAWRLARYRSGGHVVPGGIGPHRGATGGGAVASRTARGALGGRADLPVWAAEIAGAFRRLSRARTFATVAVLTLGIGIGAFTAIYGLAEAVLLEPMPYEEPDELAWVWRDYNRGAFPRGWLGGPDVAALAEQTDVFAAVAGMRTEERNLSSTDGSEPTRIIANLTTHELFDLLGVEPALGRVFRPEEDVPSGPQVAVLTHGLWRSRFGGDAGVLGRTILLDGTPTEIVGVMPEGFRFVKHGSLSDPEEADLYLPLQTDLAQMSPGGGSYAGLVRVRPDVPADRVSAALVAAAEPVNAWMSSNGSTTHVRLWSVGLTEDLIRPVRPALTALVASAAFLLLILAANLATLLLVRAAAREQEVGIRIALGAARPRILAAALSELVVIAVAGGALGAALAVAGTGLVVRLAPDDLPRLAAVGVDPTVLGVALGVTVLMTAVAALAPALFSLRTRAATATREGGRAAGGVRGTRVRSALVTAQVALSLMLLVGAALTARAFAGLLRQDPGFDAGSTLTFRVPLSDGAYPDGGARSFHDELRTRLAALPGVTAVGAANALPLTQLTNQTDIAFPDAPGNVGRPEEDAPLTDWFRVTPDYFEAAGFRVLQGRGITEADADSAAYNLVIDDVLAERFFPDGSAVGRRASFAGDTFTVVGVVDQARLYSVDRDDRGQVFLSFQRFPTNTLAYAVRTSLDPLAQAPAARALVAALDPGVPVSEVGTLQAIVDGSLGRQRLSLTLILSFAAGALLLASLGIYGVVSNSVVRRRQEIGVRMALGADAGGVLGLVVGQGLRLAAMGAAVGVLGALAAARVTEGIMVGVEARDPLVYAGVAAGLLGVAALASYLPARKATRIDPVEALRPG